MLDNSIERRLQRVEVDQEHARQQRDKIQSAHDRLSSEVTELTKTVNRTLLEVLSMLNSSSSNTAQVQDRIDQLIGDVAAIHKRVDSLEWWRRTITNGRAKSIDKGAEIFADVCEKFERYYTMNELKVLVYDLGIEDKVSFDDRNKAVLVREIVDHARRNGLFWPLMRYARENKPQVEWPKSGTSELQGKYGL